MALKIRFAATCSVRFPLLMPKLCEAFTETGRGRGEWGVGQVDRKTLAEALDPYRLRHRQQSRQAARLVVAAFLDLPDTHASTHTQTHTGTHTCQLKSRPSPGYDFVY